MSDQTIAAAPTVPVLEAMNIGMILDKAFQLYTHNFLLLIAITAVPQAIYALGLVGIMASAPSAAPVAGLISFVLVILSMVANGIGVGATTMVVGNRYLGKDVTFGKAYLAALRKAGPLIGGALLAFLFIGLAMMGFVVPGLILAVSYCCIPPAIMLEGVKGAKSLKRSRLLMKGFRWQAFLIYLLYVVVMYVAIIVVMVLSFLIMRIGSSGGWQEYSFVLSVLLVTVVLAPFSSVLSVLLYYSQRIRKESFDLAFLAEAMAAHTQ